MAEGVSPDEWTQASPGGESDVDGGDEVKAHAVLAADADRTEEADGPADVVLEREPSLRDGIQQDLAPDTLQAIDVLAVDLVDVGRPAQHAPAAPLLRPRRHGTLGRARGRIVGRRLPRRGCGATGGTHQKVRIG